MSKSNIEYDDALNTAAWDVLNFLLDKGVENTPQLFNNLKTALKVGIDKYNDCKGDDK